MKNLEFADIPRNSGKTALSLLGVFLAKFVFTSFTMRLKVPSLLAASQRDRSQTVFSCQSLLWVHVLEEALVS